MKIKGVYIVIIIELVLVTFMMGQCAIWEWEAFNTANVYVIACVWLFSCSLIIVFNAGSAGLLFGPGSSQTRQSAQSANEEAEG